jgi:pimeloyl-ACP methyl ester carboxylesterase
MSGDGATAGHYAQIGPANIYYELHGQGEPLLLLHGVLTSSKDLSHQIREFAEHFQVIAVDGRGHGRSSDIDEPFSYKGWANDIVQLLVQLGKAPVHVFGWSSGGVVGLELAMSHPELIKKLAVFGTDFHHTGIIDGWVDTLFSLPPESKQLAIPREGYQRVSPHPQHWPVYYRKAVEMLQSQPTYTTAQLHTIKAPTLVMAGDSDVIKPEHSRALAAAIADSTLVIFPDSTHYTPVDKPDLVNRMVLDFLKDQGSAFPDHIASWVSS